jgi:hypothetical protein
MSQGFLEADQYRIKELFIQGKEGPPVNIQNLFEEVNLYDSIFLPVCSGNIIITDTIRLTDRLRFDGTEVISIYLTKEKQYSALSYRKNFRIYKQSDRTNINQNTERYILHFVADEYISSTQQKVNKSYKETYSKAARNIMDQFIKTQHPKIFENSFGIRDIIIPNLSPLEAIDWCAKRALSQKNSPEFVFYSDSNNFNFVTLSNLLKQKPILDSPIRFGAKNLTSGNPVNELYMAKGLEIVSQTDIVDKIQKGVYSGSLVGFDTSTGAINTQKNDFEKNYAATEHANKNPLDINMKNENGTTLQTSYDSNKAVYVTRGDRVNSNYIKQADPKSINKNEAYEKLVIQRKAIFSNLTSRKIKLSMPGNFLLTSGKMIELDVAPFSVKSSAEKEARDKSLSGKYLIVATRHVLGLNKHTTFIEIATDSTTDKRKISGSSAQDALARKKISGTGYVEGI